MGRMHDGYLIARATAITLRDSERTDQIHVVEELTSRGRMAALLAKHAGDPELQDLLRNQPELRSDQVDYDQLRALPADTLGGRYVRHLDDNGITADYQAAPSPHVEDPILGYLVRRFRQTHDVWHALIELGTAPHEEVIIHAFSWGQLRLPVSAMVLFFGTLKHLVLERRWGALRGALREAYQHGLSAAPLMPVYWERLWEQPLDQVRARYRVQPCTRALVDS